MGQEIHWGTPHQRAPIIGGKQFTFICAVTDETVAQRMATPWRKGGHLVRVQKKSITSRFGKKRRITGHCWVVFVSREMRK